MRVAAIQMNSTPNQAGNFQQAHDLLIQAIDKGCEFVAFPENFSVFAPETRATLAAAETLKGMTVRTLQEWAAENSIWILGGSLPIKSTAKRVTNTSLLISPDGDITARYDKIHLFDATLSKDGQTYRESKYVKPGTRVVSTRMPFGRVGLSICYDVRFPELYRKMVSQGDLRAICIPSAFLATTGRAHWDLLTRARAVENQCFVIAPAQCGSPYPGRETYGHTRIIDPWGKILAERPAGPGIVWADLNFDELERVRRELPALKNRRI